jgi:diguanylate cyclase (GGDEF)-like protein
VPASAARSESSKRTDERFARAKGIFLTIVGIYAYEILLLTGFCAAGYVAAWVPIAFGGLAAIVPGIVGYVLYSGWNRDQKDFGLFLPLVLFAIMWNFCLILSAPQIAFQPIAALVAVAVFGFLAPSRNIFLFCWTLELIGSAIVIVYVGPRIEIPTATLAGQILTWGVIAGVLARCIWLVSLVRNLLQRIREKHAALNAALKRIEILASKDELTGLDNRRSLTQMLGEQIALHERAGLSLCVAMLDIDYFKRINDEFGHGVGDQVLRIFAELVTGVLRATDRLGRYGGEEFMVILPATTAQEAAGPMQRIRDAISDHDWSSVVPRVTVTIGVTEYRLGESLDELVKRADQALYRGKDAGRDRVVIDQTPLERKAGIKLQG